MVNVKNRVLKSLALLLRLSHQICDVTPFGCSTLKGDQTCETKTRNISRPVVNISLKFAVIRKGDNS